MTILQIFLGFGCRVIKSCDMMEKMAWLSHFEAHASHARRHKCFDYFRNGLSNTVKR